MKHLLGAFQHLAGLAGDYVLHEKFCVVVEFVCSDNAGICRWRLPDAASYPVSWQSSEIFETPCHPIPHRVEEYGLYLYLGQAVGTVVDLFSFAGYSAMSGLDGPAGGRLGGAGLEVGLAAKGASSGGGHRATHVRENRESQLQMSGLSKHVSSRLHRRIASLRAAGWFAN